VTFRSSRMAELLTPSVRCAYRDFQSVDMQSSSEQVSKFQRFNVSKRIGFVFETFETLKL
jgi:hypothetical protein